MLTFVNTRFGPDPFSCAEVALAAVCLVRVVDQKDGFLGLPLQYFLLFDSFMQRFSRRMRLSQLIVSRAVIGTLGLGLRRRLAFLGHETPNLVNYERF
jgi:hypothetical protein